MNFEDLVKKRRSVRGFTPGKKVDLRHIVDAVECANQIPMAGNIPFLRFILVEDPEKIIEIAEHAQQSFIANASHTVVVCSNKEQIKRNFESKGEDFVKQQAGAAIQNFLLKITESGLSSCWVGHFAEKPIKKLFKVPKNWDVEAILPVGHAAPNIIGNKPIKEDTRKPTISDSLYFEDFETNKRK